MVKAGAAEEAGVRVRHLLMRASWPRWFLAEEPEMLTQSEESTSTQYLHRKP